MTKNGSHTGSTAAGVAMQAIVRVARFGASRGSGEGPGRFPECTGHAHKVPASPGPRGLRVCSITGRYHLDQASVTFGAGTTYDNTQLTTEA